LVIALAVARDGVVVTGEDKGSLASPKIPVVCEALAVRCMTTGGVHPGPGADVLAVLRRCPVTRAGPGDVRNRLFRQLLSIAAGRRSR
jgi:hypothetical protein